MLKIGFQETLNVVSNSTNRRILEILKNGMMSAGEISAVLNMTPAATSYHLSKLKNAGLIYESKYKNFIYYEIDLSILNEIVVWINNLKGDNENEKK